MVNSEKNRTFVARMGTNSFWLNLTTMKEEWRDVLGFEGIYKINENGVVMRLKRTTVDVNGRKLIYGQKIIKPGVSRDGYLTVRLVQENGFCITKGVHVLVAQAFIPNPNNLPCVNHKDENKLNPNVSNLEWCSYSYNNTYGTLIERRKKKPLTSEPYNASEISLRYQKNGVIFDNLSETKKSHQKFVILINEKGEELKKYKSVSEAARDNCFERHLFSRTKTRQGVKIIKDKIFIVEEKDNEYIPKGKKGERPDISKRASKRVRQFLKNGEYVQTFDSVKLAAIFLNNENRASDIVNCCNGKLKSAYGYLWSYEGSPDPKPFKNKIKRSIEQYTLDGKFVSKYESINDAIKKLGQGTTTCIGNNLAGRTHSAFGYIWKYAKD